MRGRLVGWLCLVAIGWTPPALARQAAPSSLKAGAARVEITPPASSLGPTDSIRDPLFVRAMVIGNATDCAVLIGADVIGLGDALVRTAIDRASAATGCAAENFVVSATHTHSSAATLRRGPPADAAAIEQALVKAAIDARAAMRPARIGFATRSLDLNINRDLLLDGRWVQGPNPGGPSDKSLAVLEVLDTDGLPIGVYVNYAMHPINFYMSGVVSADFAGEASRYIERRYGADSVAIFAQGASGDQNPAFVGPMNRLSRARAGVAGTMAVTAPPPWRPGVESTTDVRNRFEALAKPVPADRLPAYRAAIADVSDIVTATGTIIGEAVIDTMRFRTPAPVARATIRGVSTTVSCPGRDRLDADDPVREGALPPYADGRLVTIRVGVVRLGDAHIVTVDGEVYSEIGLRLRRETPGTQLMMTTLANGAANSGYIYSDAARDNLTFQVIGSRLKPGCAETAIVEAAKALIARLAS
ncbi:neutral/alkaline non-lysosomal ceramidase N-terminal domain-containing protein [Sphingomonas floccifaciens]|uniref:Neutral/alkaline non-lysosomal ceramidase N-terminal domain-containing protein n=1 Tax=Sphingomonas floccifaciens TaxID=1844115 RepID=A0ABW4N8R6_9SPHN